MATLCQRIAHQAEALGADRDALTLVAVSGGVDSTVLLRCLVSEGFACHAVHVNYGMRPEADADAAWVAALADELGIELTTASARIAAAGNVQDQARQSRYGAFQDAAATTGAQFVALGHTADDQAETLLMNLVRGAGLRGLAGMSPARAITQGSAVRLIRPMLAVTRSEIEAHAHALGWNWAEDASNGGDTYLRNRMRRGVIPLLKQEGGTGTILRIASAADAARDALESGAAHDLAQLTLRGTEHGAIDLEAFRVVPKARRRAIWAEALAHWTPDAPRNADIIRDLDTLIGAQPGKHVDAGQASVWRDRDRLSFRAAPDPIINCQVPCDGAVETPWGSLSTGPVGHEPPSLLELDLPSSALSDGLRLRTWRTADRIEDRADRAPRNVSDILSETRVQPSFRGRQLVLTWNEEVLWLIGHAPTAHFPAANPTTSVRLRWDSVAGRGVPR